MEGLPQKEKFMNYNEMYNLVRSLDVKKIKNYTFYNPLEQYCSSLKEYFNSKHSSVIDGILGLSEHIRIVEDYEFKNKDEQFFHHKIINYHIIKSNSQYGFVGIKTNKIGIERGMVDPFYLQERGYREYLFPIDKEIPEDLKRYGFDDFLYNKQFLTFNYEGHNFLLTATNGDNNGDADEKLQTLKNKLDIHRYGTTLFQCYINTNLAEKNIGQKYEELCCDSKLGKNYSLEHKSFNNSFQSWRKWIGLEDIVVGPAKPE
jgi:hypothetical protein